MTQGVISALMTDAHRPREPCGDDIDGATVIRGLDLGSPRHDEPRMQADTVLDLVVRSNVPNLSWWRKRLVPIRVRYAIRPSSESERKGARAQ